MEQQLTQLTGALLVAVAALAYLALRAWRNQSLEQARLLGELSATLEHDNPIGLVGAYVATTFHDQPLNRIKALGLGMRGKASVEVSGSGISIWRVGETTIHLPADAIFAVDQATAVIDRAVESGGLVRTSWVLNGQKLDSYIRFSNKSDQDLFFKEVRMSGLVRNKQGDKK